MANSASYIFKKNKQKNSTFGCQGIHQAVSIMLTCSLFCRAVKWYHTLIYLNTKWPQRRDSTALYATRITAPPPPKYETGFLIWNVYCQNGIRSMLNVFWCIIWVPSQAPDPDGTSCCGERRYSGWDWAKEQTIRLASNGKMCINPVYGQHFHST